MGSYAADDFKFIGTGDGHAEDECIDIKAPCKDGKETAKCPRLEGKELKKGTNIQMWKCHGEDNQAFEFVNGRIRNPPTGLCLDIKADCKDGSDKADCERESVEDIKKKIRRTCNCGHAGKMMQMGLHRSRMETKNLTS